jgi:hypothetical protein
LSGRRTKAFAFWCRHANAGYEVREIRNGI